MAYIYIYPDQEEITLFKDRIPTQLIQPPRKQLLDSPGSGFVFHDVSKEKLSAQASFVSSNHAPVLRTVFMPNNNMEALSFEIQSVRLQVLLICIE